MKKLVILLGFVLILTSCASAEFKGSKMIRVSTGLSKAEVVRAVGEPSGVGGSGNVEVLHYREDMGWYRFKYYFVRLVDGKVESYGPEGNNERVSETNP